MRMYFVLYAWAASYSLLTVCINSVLHIPPYWLVRSFVLICKVILRPLDSIDFRYFSRYNWVAGLLLMHHSDFSNSMQQKWVTYNVGGHIPMVTPMYIPLVLSLWLHLLSPLNSIGNISRVYHYIVGGTREFNPSVQDLQYIMRLTGVMDGAYLGYEDGISLSLPHCDYLCDASKAKCHIGITVRLSKCLSITPCFAGQHAIIGTLVLILSVRLLETCS